jgi:hypothetical protein
MTYTPFTYTPAPFYLLALADPDYPENYTQWVMRLDGYESEAAAQSAINWQRRGTDRTYWAISTRTGPATFRTLDGRDVTLEGRGPYIEKAWAGFIASWKEPTT